MLVRKEVENITEKQKKLVEDNHNLIFSFLKKYDLSNDDYYDLAAIGLCNAAINYQDDISKFSTYAWKCMNTSVSNATKKYKKTIPEELLVYYQAEKFTQTNEGYSLLDFIPSSDNVESYVTSKMMCEKYKSMLDDRERKVLDLLVSGYKQDEVGKTVGCSQPHVTRIKKKIADCLTVETGQ